MKKLESCEPATIFAELYAFFVPIAKLSREEAIAAWHAVSFYEKHLPEPVGEFVADLIRAAKGAIEDRALAIHAETPKEKMPASRVVLSQVISGIRHRLYRVEDAK